MPSSSLKLQRLETVKPVAVKCATIRLNQEDVLVARAFHHACSTDRELVRRILMLDNTVGMVMARRR